MRPFKIKLLRNPLANITILYININIIINTVLTYLLIPLSLKHNYVQCVCCFSQPSFAPFTPELHQML